MKIGILYSGLIRNSPELIEYCISTFEGLLEHHDVKLFCTSWYSQPDLPNYPIVKFPDPEFRYYAGPMKTVMQTLKKMREQTSKQHWANQEAYKKQREQLKHYMLEGRKRYWQNMNGHLAYAYAYRHYQDQLEDCDIVIRARYDACFFVNDLTKIYINKIIKNCLRTGRIFGIGHKTPHNSYEVDKFHIADPEDRQKRQSNNWIFDHTIIHRKDKFDYKHALRLHKDKMLDFGEKGWTQIFFDSDRNKRKHYFTLSFPMHLFESNASADTPEFAYFKDYTTRIADDMNKKVMEYRGDTYFDYVKLYSKVAGPGYEH